MKRHEGGELVLGVTVKTEWYSQDEPTTRGYRRRSPSNETCLVSQGVFTSR